MTLVKRNGSYALPISNFFDDFLTKDLFNSNWLTSSIVNGSIPKVNIVETNNDFRVEMAAPGLKRDDFKVELDNNMLTISSELNQQNESNDEGNYTRREFAYESFTRTFHLPDTVDADQIEAKYQDGILKLAIPKRDEAKKKPIKTIKIA